MLDLLLMFVLALLPILWLVLALCGMKMEAWKASLGALVVAATLAIGVWKMTPINAATAALEGMAMAIWPIVIVIIAAILRHGRTAVHFILGQTVGGMLQSCKNTSVFKMRVYCE